MFGKRKAAPGSPAAEAPRTGNAAPPAQDFSTGDADPSANVIVRRSAVEAVQADESAYDLVQAIVDFVNNMQQHGLYTRDEIVDKAVQAYHADYYLAQVNNGGHSQFIHNSGSNAHNTNSDACAALQAMGADAHLRLLEKMIAWTEANPDEVGKQTGFDGGRAEELDELDTAFYAAEKVSPMIRASTQWIRQWPELRIVEDTDYEQAINHLAFMNPARESRLVARRIGSFEHQINDWLHVSIGMAATACAETEVRLGIGGGSVMSVEGEQQMVWSLQTNNGRRFALVTNDGARLFECVEADNPPMPAIGDTKGMLEAMRDGRMEQYKAPLVGPCLSHVEADRIAELVQYANRFNSAAAIDLLLRQVRDESASVPLSAVEISRNDEGAATVKWILATEHAPFFALTSEKGATLLRPGETRATATLRADEIARHAEQNAL